MDELTERQQAVLEFERRWWKFAGAKEAKIRDEFGVSAVRYYQELDAVLDMPAALAYDAVLVRRLVRLREARARVRRG